jgi:hypothetical protein
MSEAAPKSARSRPRRSNPLRQAAEDVSQADAVGVSEPENTQRPALRAPLREEDPRERAARRAAEIRGNLGDMEEGPDDFYINQSDIPDGWSYEWKRKSVWGQEDPSYQVQLARMGWEPVPADRHPSYMPDKGNYTTIERKGMVLMERPKELTDEARAIELKKARNQVRQKEAQLNVAPDAGQFDRDNKGSPLVKVKKSYEAIPIPNE